MSNQKEWRVEVEGTITEAYYVFADNKEDAIAEAKKEAEFDELIVISFISAEEYKDEHL